MIQINVREQFKVYDLTDPTLVKALSSEAPKLITDGTVVLDISGCPADYNVTGDFVNAIVEKLLSFPQPQLTIVHTFWAYDEDDIVQLFFHGSSALQINDKLRKVDYPERLRESSMRLQFHVTLAANNKRGEKVSELTYP